MRVTLLHKPSAGEGAHTRESLVGLFERHGHAVTYQDADDDGWPAAIDVTADALAVAGGDGTVGSVATRLMGRGVPLLVLPLGTANNLACRLGLGDDPGSSPGQALEALVAGLDGAARRPFDVGVARGPWGVCRFVEGVGLGAFARAMAFAKTEQGTLIADPSDREETLDRDLRLLRAVLRDLDAHACRLALDSGIEGEVEETSYLLLEVSNTGLVGPNVVLAPEAAPGDGRLSVVVAGEADRAALEDYLDARLEGEAPPPLALPVRHAREVRLTVAGVRVHVDDALWPEEDAPPPAADVPFEVALTLEAGALDVLVPEGA